MTEPTPSIPTSVVVKRKRGRPRKSETEGMPNAINQPSQKRKPKKLKVNSNPLEMFQNITNEDEVVEFEVEKIVNKEVDPITNQIWYWVKFKDISDAQKIAAEDCNCEEIIQDYERRISRKRKYTKKAIQSNTESSTLSRNPLNILPPSTGILSQSNNTSTLDEDDSSSEDDENSDNEQSFQSWPKSVVEKRTNPAGEVLYKVKFESIFFRWVNPKTENTSSRQTIQELCNEYEKAINNMIVKDEKTTEEERRARLQTQSSLHDSSRLINNNTISNNNNNNSNNESNEPVTRLLVEEVKSLRKELEQIRLKEEQNREQEEHRRQEWLTKVTTDIESVMKDKEEILKRRAQQQEDEIQRKMREAEDKVIMANQILQAEEQRLQEYASKIREAQKIVAAKPGEPGHSLQIAPTPVVTTTPHSHVPHAASPSTDSGVSSPPGHSAPNTPSEENSLQNSIALMFQSTTEPANPMLSSDPTLSFHSPEPQDDLISYSLGNDTPRSADMYRFCNSLDLLQLQNHPPATISPTALHQDMVWPYSLPEETDHWDEITDDLQKDTTDGLTYTQPPVTTIPQPQPQPQTVPPPQVATRPLHIPRITLPQGATAKLANGDVVSVPGGKPKAPAKRKTKPKTDELDKKAKKAVSKKTTTTPVKPPVAPRAPS